MKKLVLNFIMILVLGILVIISTGNILQASVAGQCDNCHTMHNSQDGAPMTVAGGPVNNFLTRSTCLGCHGGVSDGVTVGNAPDVFGDPGLPDDMCAGGTFTSTVINSMTKVHNVIDVSDDLGLETTLSVVPGAEAGSLGAAIQSAGLNKFSCAGTYGCHGDHSAGKETSDEGIKGFHHDATAGYRYCQTADATPNKIEGKGDDTWEAGGATTEHHNVYYADTGGISGINALCAECHGDFHGTDDTGTGPFQRHPTNNLLSDAVADAGWNLGSVTVDYDNNPFCFDKTDAIGLATNADYTTTNARVACVSCHRAHGTPYADILRFDYSTQLAGQTSSTVGCLGCHHLQR